MSASALVQPHLDKYKQTCTSTLGEIQVDLYNQTWTRIKLSCTTEIGLNATTLVQAELDSNQAELYKLSWIEDKLTWRQESIDSQEIFAISSQKFTVRKFSRNFLQKTLRAQSGI